MKPKQGTASHCIIGFDASADKMCRHTVGGDTHHGGERFKNLKIASFSMEHAFFFADYQLTRAILYHRTLLDHVQWLLPTDGRTQKEFPLDLFN